MDPHCNSASIASLNPLSEAGTLNHVLGFVGSGHWLFCSLVDKLWLQIYQSLQNSSESAANYIALYGEHITYSSSAFSSVSRLQLAADCGLLLATGLKLQRNAGRYADIETLALAHELGLPYTARVVRGAAVSGSLLKLKYLHLEQDCTLPDNISWPAAESGSIEVLTWLRQQGCHFDAGTCERAATGKQALSVVTVYSSTAKHSTCQSCSIEWEQTLQDVILQRL
jgi:hypothetical protein